jgi:hypothetical protein
MENAFPPDNLRIETPIAGAEEKSAWMRLKSYLRMVGTKRGMAVVAGLLIMPILLILWLGGAFKSAIEGLLGEADSGTVDPTNVVLKFIVKHHLYILASIVFLTILVAASLVLYSYRGSNMGAEERNRTLFYGIVFSLLIFLIILAIFVVVLGRKYSTIK